MKVSEFLSPLFAGYRSLRPTQGKGHHNLISARVRSLLANALGVKKLRYAAYHNIPKDPMHNGAFHICVEGLSEAQKRRESPDPEVLCIGLADGCQF